MQGISGYNILWISHHSVFGGNFIDGAMRIGLFIASYNMIRFIIYVWHFLQTPCMLRAFS